jgi:2-polyprenyl-6-methoxyphenol hydroxylase-like FAD-dependent oxidoreductase
VTAPPSPTDVLTTRCAIAGGGPAGMMLGLLLARAGVDAIVLEKHADFLRDFRGDTVHPSTLAVLDEIGLYDALLARPHRRVTSLAIEVEGRRVRIADFARGDPRYAFIAFLPQWDFLDVLAVEASRYPTFGRIMEAEVVGLIEEGGQVVGVRATTSRGPIEVRADLVVGADGRSSTVRACARLPVRDLGAPMDVVWLRVERRPEDGEGLVGRAAAGRLLVMIDRGAYWQCGLVIPKGGIDALRREGPAALRARIASLAPELADRLGAIGDVGDLAWLTVRVDRLLRWHRPGLLCLGDAAHAMSPIGGVGVNLAVQDAVAAANLLAGPLRAGTLDERDLAAVARRRALPTRVTQRAQLLLQDRLVGRVLGGRPPSARALALFERWPALQRIPARLLGVGVRPEHVAA